MLRIKTKNLFLNSVLLIYCLVVIAEFYGVFSIRTSQIIMIILGAASMAYYCVLRRDLKNLQPNIWFLFLYIYWVDLCPGF